MTFASVEKFGEVTRTIDTNIVDALRFAAVAPERSWLARLV